MWGVSSKWGSVLASASKERGEVEGGGCGSCLIIFRREVLTIGASFELPPPPFPATLAPACPTLFISGQVRPVAMIFFAVRAAFSAQGSISKTASRTASPFCIMSSVLLFLLLDERARNSYLFDFRIEDETIHQARGRG